MWPPPGTLEPKVKEAVIAMYDNIINIINVNTEQYVTFYINFILSVFVANKNTYKQLLHTKINNNLHESIHV